MLKKLRSIFIIDEEQSALPGKTEKDPRPTPASPALEDAGTDDVKVKVRGGEVSEKFLNVLLEAMDRHDLEGFDYIEFRRFLNSLDAVNLDEPTRFRTAFATGQTMGATKDGLLNSAGQYLEILKKEEDRFEQAVQHQRSKVVEEKQAGIAALEQQIVANEQEIARLTEENAKIKQKIQKRKEEVALAQSKIQQTQRDFEQTYQHLVSQLQDDMDKIRKYVP